ncbi:MAG: sulfatase [Armatimonadota bacterium]
MDRPNILLIVLDSARADRFSCYGYEKPTTPNIDRIASEGTLFEQCWGESNWTLPVSYSLMTGLATREHGSENYRELPDGLPTLPRALEGSDWHTILCSANAFMGTATGMHEAFDEFEMASYEHPLFKPLLKYLFLRMAWADKGGADINRKLLRHLATTDDPWLAVLWNDEPHHPWVGRGEFAGKFADRPISLRRRWDVLGRARRLQEFGTTGSERDLEDLNALYDGCVGYADHLVGQLRERLEAMGRWDDTLVIITADHGDMLGERGLTGHGRPAGMYRQLIRLPLVVHGPGFPSAERSGATVQLTDITQTVGEITGALDGLAPTASSRVDLRDAATGAGREYAICERIAWPEERLQRAQKANPSFDFSQMVGEVRSCFRDGWHLVDMATGPTELFDTATDPHETSDLIEQEADLARELLDILDDWRRRAQPHPATEGLVERDDPKVEARLRGMGYF